MPENKSDRRDIVIIGGGHNGLVTAFYLAKAGFKPLVLERRAQVGGAAVTDEFHSWLSLLHAGAHAQVRFVRISSATCNWKSTAYALSHLRLASPLSRPMAAPFPCTRKKASLRINRCLLTKRCGEIF